MRQTKLDLIASILSDRVMITGDISNVQSQMRLLRRMNVDGLRMIQIWQRDLLDSRVSFSRCVIAKAVAS
jgi:hypothetical protein